MFIWNTWTIFRVTWYRARILAGARPSIRLNDRFVAGARLCSHPARMGAISIRPISPFAMNYLILSRTIFSFYFWTNQMQFVSNIAKTRTELFQILPTTGLNIAVVIFNIHDLSCWMTILTTIHWPRVIATTCSIFYSAATGDWTSAVWTPMTPPPIDSCKRDPIVKCLLHILVKIVS